MDDGGELSCGHTGVRCSQVTWSTVVEEGMSDWEGGEKESGGGGERVDDI